MQFLKAVLQVHSPRISGALVGKINSEQVSFPMILIYSIERLNLPAHSKEAHEFAPGSEF